MQNDGSAEVRSVAGRVIRLASLWVPVADRGVWLRQWQAELAHRQIAAALTGGSAAAVTRWSFGALRHAFWMRRKQWRPDGIVQDVGFAVRALRRRPALAITATATLAVGIGATTALFSVVNGALLRPLPYPDPDRLVMVFQRHHGWMASADPFFAELGREMSVSYPIYQEWVAQGEVFAAITAMRGNDHTIQGEAGAERVHGTAVAGDLTAVLGVQPALGRWFMPDEDRGDGPRLLVLGHTFWRDRLGSRSDVLGTEIVLSDESYEIIGVMPPGFAVPRGTAYWINMPSDQRNPEWGSASLQSLGRLIPGRDIADAESILESHTQALAETNDRLDEMGARVMPLLEYEIGSERGSFFLLLGAAALLLLIACANVASLLLVRGSERRNEIAVRAALGARRGRLVRQFVAESVVLGCVGGLFGTVLAFATTQRIVELLPSRMRARPVDLDLNVLLVAAGLALLAGLVVGLIGCLDVVRQAPARCLAAASTRATGSRGQQRALSTVVVAQVALALVLLIGASLMVTSLSRLMAVERGFREDGITTLSVALPDGAYDEPAAINAFTQQVIDRLHALPGVEHVAVTDSLPFGGSTSSTTFEVEGVESDDMFAYSSLIKTASPEYFEGLGIPLRDGRGFVASDSAAGERVVLLNQIATDKFFPDTNPIGQRVRRNDDAPWARVVGIVGNVLHGSLTEDPPAIIYQPFAQAASRRFRFAVRGLADGDLSVARGVIAEVDETVPVEGVDTLAALVRTDAARPRARTILVTLAAGLALTLSMIGVYGAIAYAVRQRVREIGIRIALGARGVNVVRDVLRWGLGLATIGVALGLVGAIALGRLLSSFLYAVEPSDPATLAGASVVLLAITAIACARPAARAASTDPASVLRAD